MTPLWLLIKQNAVSHLARVLGYASSLALVLCGTGQKGSLEETCESGGGI